MEAIGPVNKYNFCFCIMGLGRTGHNAIARWIISQPQGKNVLLNFKGHFSKQSTVQDGKFLRKKHDVSKVNFLGVRIQGSIERSSEFSVNVPRLIVLRDIKNYVASLHKHGYFKLSEWHLDEWEKYILQALGKENFIDHLVSPINYYKWFSMKKYRVEVLEGLGSMLGTTIPFNDRNISENSGTGGGSSFANLKDARKMDVLNRYKHQDVLDAVKNIPKRLLDLNKEYFGDIYE